MVASKRESVNVDIKTSKEILDLVYNLNWIIGMRTSEDAHMNVVNPDRVWLRDVRNSLQKAIQTYPHNAFLRKDEA
jgi:hypothetical protein